MQLWLLRHGESGLDAPSDFERVLTSRGRDDIARISDILARECPGLEKLMVSPYARTRETAAIVMELIGLDERIIQYDEAVTSEAGLDVACKALENTFAGSGSGLVVTHQPLISRLIHYLTGEHVQMAPGNLAEIEAPVIERGCCSLICVH